MVAIEFENGEYTVQESNGTVTVCLTTDRGIAEPLSVEVFTNIKLNSRNPACEYYNKLSHHNMARV